MRNRGIALTIMAAAIFAVACGSDDTPTGTAAVVSVTVSQPPAAILVGATTTLTATTKDGSGAAITGTTVAWSSSSDAIATVSQSGVVTGVAPGTATITATSNGKTGTATVTVNSKIVTFKATMSGANEVPANATTGSGSFTATLDTTTNQFTYDITFSGLSSNVTLGHIHGPAAVGVNAGTTINFATLAGGTFTLGATSGTAHGVTTLVAATAITATVNGDSLKKLLFAGLTYANIHTTNNGGGEIRGQITKQ
jgi:CHRD domain-containing protein/Big-like domain-containing protein